MGRGAGARGRADGLIRPGGELVFGSPWRVMASTPSQKGAIAEAEISRCSRAARDGRLPTRCRGWPVLIWSLALGVDCSGSSASGAVADGDVIRVMIRTNSASRPRGYVQTTYTRGRDRRCGRVLRRICDKCYFLPISMVAGRNAYLPATRARQEQSGSGDKMGRRVRVSGAIAQLGERLRWQRRRSPVRARLAPLDARRAAARSRRRGQSRSTRPQERLDHDLVELRPGSCCRSSSRARQRPIERRYTRSFVIAS